MSFETINQLASAKMIPHRLLQAVKSAARVDAARSWRRGASCQQQHFVTQGKYFSGSPSGSGPASEEELGEFTESESDRGTVTLDGLYSNLRFLAEGIPDKTKRGEALEKVNTAYERHQTETDAGKIQELLLEAQSHMKFFKMVSRRKLEKNDGGVQHFVYNKDGELESGFGNKVGSTGMLDSKTMDKSQVTSEHRRRHEGLIRRQHFLNR